jgi:hypothetical protein
MKKFFIVFALTIFVMVFGDYKVELTLALRVFQFLLFFFLGWFFIYPAFKFIAFDKEGDSFFPILAIRVFFTSIFALFIFYLICLVFFWFISLI